MSRYSGSQHRGAARQMRTRLRDAAEMRQAAERARDAARAAAQPLVRDLTDDEVAELLGAVRTVTARLCHQLALLTPKETQR